MKRFYNIMGFLFLVISILCFALFGVRYFATHRHTPKVYGPPVGQMECPTHRDSANDQDPLCHYVLDQEHLERCQKLIADYGHIDLQAIDGEAYALKSGIGTGTFVVILRCIDHECMVSAVAIHYKNDELEKFVIQPLKERLPSK